jgi:hypothetical protein
MAHQESALLSARALGTSIMLMRQPIIGLAINAKECGKKSLAARSAASGALPD